MLMSDLFRVLAADRASTFKNGLVVKGQHLVHIAAQKIQSQLLLLLDPHQRCKESTRSCVAPRLMLLALGRLHRSGHLGVEVKQLFQPFGVVLKAAADIDAL